MRQLLLAGLSCALLAGCEALRVEPGPCAELTGRFEATTLEFTSRADPGIGRDFITANAGFTVDITPGGSFTTVFADALGNTITRTGTFETFGNSVLFGTSPLFPDAAAGDQRFVCSLNGDVVTLESADLLFDFDRDGEFEEADFVATLGRV